MQGRTAGAQGPAEALGSPSGRGSTDVLAAGNHGVTVSHRRANAAVSPGGDSRSGAENDALSRVCLHSRPLLY